MNSQKDIYIFIGPPGSGKGYIIPSMCKKVWLESISTGNLCRKHIAEQTEIGKQIDFAIKSGKLVSDSLIIAMVKNGCLANADQFDAVILDGFPRTIAQAQALHEFC